MIGKRLAAIRKENGDTQQALAGRLGVSISTVRSWEQGRNSPSSEMVAAICKLYGASANYLLGLPETDRPRPGAGRLTAGETRLLREFEAFLLSRRRGQKGRGTGGRAGAGEAAAALARVFPKNGRQAAGRMANGIYSLKEQAAGPGRGLRPALPSPASARPPDSTAAKRPPAAFLKHVPIIPAMLWAV